MNPSATKAITSPANPLIKKIKSLALKKYRDEEKTFRRRGCSAYRRGDEGRMETRLYRFRKTRQGYSPSGRRRKIRRGSF
jgi:hypothetical protein